MSPPKRIQFTYSKDQLNEALKACKGEHSAHPKLSFRRASSIFKVPRSTLQNKISGKTPLSYAEVGPKTIFAKAEEMVLVNYIDMMVNRKMPISKQDVMRTAK